MSGTSTSRSDRYRHWPDLQFHFGLTYDELRSMPHARRRLYEEALPRLLAEQQARTIDAVSFPHMKKEAQRKMIRSINRATGADKPVVPQSKGEAAARAGSLGIAIRTVPAGGKT